jgi:carbon-monoxide dehydrogenase large subunit
MNIRFDENALALTKFGIGQPVPRAEDPMLLRGEGRYADDVSVPGQVHAAVVRSPYAHGILRGIDTEAAAGMPGVIAIYTGNDLTEYAPIASPLPLKNADGSPMRRTRRDALATDRVRFVGDPVALVVAKTAAQAQDAAEAVVLDVDELPAVIEASEAVKPGAPLLYDDAPENTALDFRFGDQAAVEAAFAEAAHVTRLHVVNNRLVVNALEPRSALAQYDRKTGRFTFTACSQGTIGMRNALADVLKVPRDRVRVVTGQVGGSFGMKGVVFPEYVALLHAAKALRKPVKWTDKRSESFVSDHHGRDHEVDLELALDAKGRILALRLDGFGNLGGYMSPMGPMMASLNIAKNIASVYRTPAIAIRARCVFTNTVPTGAYRGAGRPEGNYYMERLLDTAARETGVDPALLRRRNHVPAAALPYTAASGMTYDSGDFTGLLDRALEAADWKGFKERRSASRKRGLLRGRGIGQYLEVTAPPIKEMGGIRFEKDGTVTILTGTLDFGQGHWSAFAQVLVSKLGVPFDAVRLVQGDSDRLIAGGGTGGSKSIMASGAAILEAGEKVIERGRLFASHALEAGVEDIEFRAGNFRIAGTDRAIGIMELARRLNEGSLRPPPELPATLDVDHVHESAPSAFPNGCHVAEVEIDPETGTTRVVRYTAVNDFGTVINPMLVEGQLHGGVVQGIGQALLERTVFDESGQLVTGSFMDYAMPRADDAPFFSVESRPTPAKTNLLGAKGCGEAGCAGSLPAVMNAVVDALAEFGVMHVDMPATPEKIWALIQEGRSRSGTPARG